MLGAFIVFAASKAAWFLPKGHRDYTPQHDSKLTNHNCRSCVQISSAQHTERMSQSPTQLDWKCSWLAKGRTRKADCEHFVDGFFWYHCGGIENEKFIALRFTVSLIPLNCMYTMTMGMGTQGTLVTLRNQPPMAGWNCSAWLPGHGRTSVSVVSSNIFHYCSVWAVCSYTAKEGLLSYIIINQATNRPTDRPTDQPADPSNWSISQSMLNFYSVYSSCKTTNWRRPWKSCSH